MIGRETAWKEATFRWKADQAAYRKVQVEVDVKKVLDLSDEKVQKRYGTSKDELIGDDYRPTQRLANTLRSEGFEAFWTYSRADQPHGKMLVVFLENLASTSTVVVKAVRKV